MKALALVFLLILSGCGSMQLTNDARRVKVLRASGNTVNEVYRVKGECQLLGELASDDRNEILNEGASKGADTIILSQGPLFRPDHLGQFYRCQKKA